MAKLGIKRDGDSIYRFINNVLGEVLNNHVPMTGAKREELEVTIRMIADELADDEKV